MSKPTPMDDAWTTRSQSDTSSLSGTTSVYTPTHTTAPPNLAALPAPFSTDGGIGSAPEAGGTYMIRHVDTGRAITLCSGELLVRADAGTDGGWRWHCSESEDGWLSFRETVSGAYLGRDGRGGFWAKVLVPKGWERLLIRPREDGGCNIFAIDWWTLMALTTNDTDGKLFETNTVTKASRWEFVRV
ncbi:hypothetical protein F5Y00DRAFT_31432 [Daldinia vernicosa]|uniref:uncharacterized protein n=1 Tax=Daldinia vernicosa TaxID=114800 RepID=UPI002007A973|nr:uncharacterized protein F5Y00DRAFT_31432 [Daldinia vernicosa]KAI0850486.1 hypothetical protein F5Y00DRAFT_31432 [Daldinia vernicosa]